MIAAGLGLISAPVVIDGVTYAASRITSLNDGQTDGEFNCAEYSEYLLDQLRGILQLCQPVHNNTASRRITRYPTMPTGTTQWSHYKKYHDLSSHAPTLQPLQKAMRMKALDEHHQKYEERYRQSRRGMWINAITRLYLL